ncbi:spermine synthase [Lachancea thermotolerans CBS 6340]|uniref:KLTH0G11484p n=1 Tax=Lachancea thermotolerans (strain ATCC 56472 / CBS 6340 / NRRL Y-8284) TaxID=559295 RepID=C5DMT5_LACTC|nr:KLTH0G11484p [Lachancea thermotolerans CBS 6340]CAR25096.1 KLTH0G11484p [Lachancea thermotolerans CBS 6340]
MVNSGLIKDGWFCEVNDNSFPGQGLALKVEEVLYHSKSEFQDILVFKSSSYGNVLVLDGIIQATERDEFAYQEMISCIPLYAHKAPRKVLVIGGGDGGVVREVVKHSSVESVTLVEIDEFVIDLAKEYLPGMACTFGHHKVQVKLQDGFQFLRDVATRERYDVIITDSSDPEGPAEAFFQQEYFELLHSALNDDGIVIAQASENVWLNLGYIQNLVKTAKAVFPQARYCYTTVPTYTSGQLGLIVCAKDKSVNLEHPMRSPSLEEQSQLRYYNAGIHTASFVLPTWAHHQIYR